MDDFTDAITVELQRRVQGDIAVPLPPHSCSECAGDGMWQQNCNCSYPPLVDKWACSGCGKAYTRLDD